MIRRLNYTGRKRIEHERVKINVRRPGGGPASFTAALDLQGMELPLSASVFLEAYRQTTFRRWVVGTVGHLQLGREFDLEEFGEPDGVQFRVRVTQLEDPHGLELAEADQIKGAEADETDRQPLLPVCGRDLDALAWRLDFENGAPLLVVNERLGNWRAIAGDPAFSALVLPAAFRVVCRRILIDENQRELDDGSWQSLWLRFACSLPGLDPLPPEDSREEADDWIEQAAGAFARVHRLDDEFARFWHEGGS